MPNAKIVAIANHKGGVGKTTLTYCLAAAKAKAGNMVLMIDFDFQSSLTIACDMYRESGADKNTNSSELFRVKASLLPYCLNVTASKLDNLFILPGSEQLAITASKAESDPRVIEILKKNIGVLRNIFDYIFIDLGPTLNSILLASLLIADEVIVPVKPEFISVSGLEFLIKTINNIQSPEAGSLGNEKLQFSGIVVNMFNKVRREHNDYLQQLAEKYKILGIIPNAAIVTKELPNGRPIVLAHPSSEVTKAYNEIASQIL